MPAGTYNFKIEQGAKFSRDFTWRNPDKTPLNINGFVFRLMAKHKYDDAEPLINLSTTEPPGGISIIDAANGRFRITLTAAQTAALNFNQAIYDLKAIPPSDDPLRLFEGQITLSKEVTK